jgi:demethylmenaquinone methyltransferase/2-methoxy-6-polyprenyl-1,4-benzoquinol methylase
MARAPHPVLRDYYTAEEERQSFVTELFDGAARHYDRVCGLMSFGSGLWYRRRALERAGLRRGMRVLDVATGTGLVARTAGALVGDPRGVIGIDPSAGMLREARKTLAGPLVQGRVEALPFASERFDVLAIGYALRHAADLEVAFRECLRVLKPDGRVLVLEISRAPAAGRRALLRFYFRTVLPLIMRLTTRDRHAQVLTRYYWETIETCVAPEAIMDVMRRSGFAQVRRTVFGGFLSEYIGVKPPT